jgi:hypothetical protein
MLIMLYTKKHCSLIFCMITVLKVENNMRTHNSYLCHLFFINTHFLIQSNPVLNIRADLIYLVLRVSLLQDPVKNATDAYISTLLIKGNVTWHSQNSVVVKAMPSQLSCPSQSSFKNSVSRMSNGPK